MDYGVTWEARNGNKTKRNSHRILDLKLEGIKCFAISCNI